MKFVAVCNTIFQILCFLSAFSHIAKAEDYTTGYSLSSGVTKTIYVFEGAGAGTAKWYKVVNSSGLNLFVPTKTATEWNAFLTKKPANVTTSETNATNCKLLLDYGKITTSGNYTIDPDGPGGIAAFSTFCDMTTNGGGWTLNFKGSANTSLYTTASQFLSENINSSASEVMVFYASESTTFTPINSRFKFTKPSGFNPFTVTQATVSLTITNLTNSTVSSASSLIYGYNNFSSYSCDIWSTTTSSYGRFGLCIGGSDATNFSNFPYYNAYNASGTDFCANSNQAYSASYCSASRFLVIFER